jgi:hypothetical protein
MTPRESPARPEIHSGGMAKRSKKKQTRLAAAKAAQLPAGFRDRIEAARLDFRAVARALDELLIAQACPPELHALVHLDADMATALCVIKHTLHEVDVTRVVADAERSLALIPEARRTFFESLAEHDRTRLEARVPMVRSSLRVRDAYIDIPTRMPSAKEREAAARDAQEKQVQRLVDLRGEMERASLEEIAQRLADLGIHGVIEEFAELAAGEVSLFGVVDRLTAERDLSESEHDIVITAVDQLWRRLLPDRPSAEILEDWMQEGYALQERDDLEGAAKAWWHLWEALRSRFDASMTTMTGADRFFDGTQSIFNWCQDFDDLLATLGENPEMAARGLRFCDEWIAQFTAEGELTLQNFHRARAGYLLQLGRLEDAEQALHAFIERWPQNPWGHIALADAYAGFHRNARLRRDITRAREHLESARRLAKDPHDIEAIRDRMSELPASS